MTRSATYQEDGTLVCDACGHKIAKMPRAHWERMQRLIEEGGMPHTPTIVTAAHLRHMDKCPNPPPRPLPHL